jgi:serine/threonine-protein kinase
MAGVWAPDGKRLAFASHGAGAPNLFWIAADGSDTAQQLLTSDRMQWPSSWSPDGRWLAFTELDPATGSDILLLPMDGDHKPMAFLKTRFAEALASFSPDGRWLAYESDESGRKEIYVRPFPGPGNKRQVSVDGGGEPLWARNGRELFYRQGDQLMAVDVSLQPDFSTSLPRALFRGSFKARRTWTAEFSYDVFPDGRRFVLIQDIEEATVKTHANLVLGWFEELRRVAPRP